MSKLLHLDNKEYISSVTAGKAVGYSHDYLSRLCRSGSLSCRRIGRVWYIERESLDSFVAHGKKASSVGRPDDIPVHNSTFYEYLAREATEPLSATVTPVTPADRGRTKSARQETANPLNSFSVISEEPLTASPVQPVQSRADRGPSIDDDNIQGSRIRKKNVLGPLVGMVSVIVVATAGYAAAQVYETPVHDLARQISADAKVGIAYLLNETDSAISGMELGPVAQGTVPERSKKRNAGNVANATSALTHMGGVLNDASNDIVLSIRSGITGLAAKISNEIPGRFEWYGKAPASILANALSPLTQKTLEDRSDIIYEPITGVNILAVAEDSSRGQVVAAVPEPSIIEQTVINQPVIERVVEKQFTVVESGVTLEQLQQTENELRALFGEYVSNQPVNPATNFRSIALTQRIDTLDGTDISNGTFASGSITNSSVAATTLSASGVATFSGGIDISSGTLEVPNSTSLPASCSIGEIYFDSDATSGQRIYACESANTWVLQGGVAADSLDFSDFLDAMTVDATTSFDLDTNAADLNFDSNTFVIDSSANRIGIGTTTPGVSLAIDGTDAVLLPVGTTAQRPTGATGLIRYNTNTTQFEGYSSGAWQGLGGVIDIDQDTYITAEESSDEDYLRLYTAGSERLTIDNSGKVGIGTSTPTYELEVYNTNARLALNASDVAGDATVLFEELGTIKGSVGYDNSEDLFVLGYGNAFTSPNIAINSSGNVGIGTTTPGKLLTVYGKVEIGGNADDSAMLTLDGNGYTGTLGIDATGLKIGHNSASRDLRFQTNSTDRVTITAGGNVGIGDSSPAALLTVGNGDLFQVNSSGELTLNESSVTYDIWIQGADVANGDARNLALLGNASTDDLILNYNTEYDCVSIGGTSCSNALDVTGTITATGNITLGFGSFQDTSVSASGASTLCYDGSGVFGACTSLSEFKENQQDLTLGLETIMQLRPVEFDWIPSKGGARDFGFIAEEVASVNPLLAAYESPGGALVGVKYRHLTALLAKGIQEIATPIDVSRAGSIVSAISIDENGNVGIGTTTPSAQLHTTGTVRFENFGAGTLTTDADGNVSVSSDERLKVVEGMFASGLSAVLAINPIQYRWNEDSGFDRDSIYTGFSAQNVREALPEAVGEDKRGFLTLSDRPILASAINAIKEVWQQLEEYMTRTERLEQRVAELEARLNEVVQVTPVVPEPTTNAATPEPEDPTLTIEVVGNNPATIEVGSTYADLGAIARDINGALLSVELTLDGNPVQSIDISTDAPATYLVTYRAQDGEGNNVQATREVIVMQNDEPAQDILTDQKSTPPEPEAKTPDSDSADTKNENGDTATSGEGEAASSSPEEPLQDDTGPGNTKETNAHTGVSGQTNHIDDSTAPTE